MKERKRQPEKAMRMILYVFVPCFFWTFSQFVGKQLQREGNIVWLQGGFPNLIRWGLFSLVLSAIVVVLFVKLFPIIREKLGKVLCTGAGTSQKRENRKRFFCMAGILFLAWLPCFLAYYPGVFDYDVLTQITQGILLPFTKYHPLLHTLFLNNAYLIGVTGFHSGTVGIAIYCVLQMIILAGCLSYAVNYLYQNGINRWVCYGLCAWFAVYPANAVMAVGVTKDTLFAGAVLVFLVQMYDTIIKNNTRMKIPCIIWGVISALLRNNMIYAIVVFVIIAFALGLISRDKKKIRPFAVIGLLVVLVFGVTDMALTSFLHAREGNPVEMFSVPIQQLARTYVAGELEEEDRLELEDIAAPAVWASYRPCLSDPVKFGVQTGLVEREFSKYVDLYMKYLRKSPGTYVNAFLELTRGMWYMGDTSYIYIYGSPNYLGHGFRLLPEEWQMPAVEQQSRLPGAKQVYDFIAQGEWLMQVPVLPLLFNPAGYCWLSVFMLLYAAYKREAGLVLWQLIPVLYGATLLLGPAVLTRYVYAFYLTVPVIVVLLLKDTWKA